VRKYITFKGDMILANASGKNRKYGRNKDKCNRYRLLNLKEKNASKRQEKHRKRQEYFAKRRALKQAENKV